VRAQTPVEGVDKDAGGRLRYSTLQSDSVYVLDQDVSVHIWIGLHSAPEARATALTMVRSSYANFERAKWVTTTTLFEGFESPEFMAVFSDRSLACCHCHRHTNTASRP
jgi:hypothetical protein